MAENWRYWCVSYVLTKQVAAARKKQIMQTYIAVWPEKKSHTERE